MSDDQHEPVVAAVYGALLDDENEGLDPLDLAVKITAAAIKALGLTEERRIGTVGASSHRYVTAWKERTDV